MGNAAVAFQDVSLKIEGLEKQKLPKEIMDRVREVRAAIEHLQKEIAPFLFSPEAAGEKIVAELKSAEGGAWSDAEYREKFNVSSAFLHRRRKEHRIVFWRDARDNFYYPRWQFDGNGALRPGIQEVLQTFQSQDTWRMMRYFLGPRTQLGGRRPLDLLQKGDVDAVLEHARLHAAENTW